MTANINPKTGIAYGVTALNNLQDWVFDEFFNHGENVSYNSAFADALAEFKEQNPTVEDTDSEYDDFCQSFADDRQSDEDTYSLEIDGMKLGLSTLGGAYNVWIFVSPHVSDTCAQCSPCCPNAGDLDSKGHYSAYTLPAGWFRTESENE